MTTSQHFFQRFLVATCSLSATIAIPACGGGSSGGNAGPGGIMTIAGTGQQATQSSDANGDGVTDPPIAHDKAMFDTPMDAIVGPDGGLFILDWNGHKVRKLTPDGMVSFIVGTGVEGDACERPRSDGTCPLVASELNHMTDVTFDAAGRMVISAWHNAKIKVADMAMDALRDTCGNGTRKFAGDGGPCLDATGASLVSFDLPSSVTLDSAGNLFIADQANQVIRRVGTDGMVKTVAGMCPSTPGFGCPLGQGYTGDGGPATAATLRNNLGQGADPQGKIALDPMGNLYIADTGNHVVRKVVPGADKILGSGDPAEEIITTFAGTGTADYSGDGGPASGASFSGPTTLAVDGGGNIYVADPGNNAIRILQPAGKSMLTTFKGQRRER